MTGQPAEIDASALVGTPVSSGDLLGCCGSRSWAERLAAIFARQWPFPTPLETAEELWWTLTDADWREAFAAHPRIGDRPPEGTQERAEQSRAEQADPSVLAAIAAGNALYERRFGMTYIVRAAGRSAEEMLAILTERLGNDPATEIRVAASAQWDITALRLAKLLTAQPV